MDKLKVVYISNEAEMGGAAQSLLNMLKGIRNYIIPFVVIPRNGIIEKELEWLEIKYYIIPFTMGFGPIGQHTREDEDNNFVDNYNAAVKLSEIIKNEKIQLIHTNSSVSNVGAIASLMTGCPHVWHFREMLEEDFGCEFWDKSLKQILINHAYIIITISDCVKKSYFDKYNINSIRIYNGLDIEKYKKNIDDKKWDDGEHKFLIAGSIAPLKGQMDVVLAMEKLHADGWENIRLYIVGPGNPGYIWLLKKYIKDNQLSKYIQVHTYMEDLSNIRSECQYSITSSRMEALGRVTIEAMLAGNIVIGANTGGTLEIIGENEERGYLYQQGDYISLAETMKRAMEEEGEIKNCLLGKAQEYAEEQFNLETYRKSVLALYNNAINDYDINDSADREEILDNLQKRYSSIPLNEATVAGNHNSTHDTEEKWKNLREKGHSLAEYFESNKVGSVAIYGMGYLGCCLYDELEESHVEIKYVIDRNYKNMCGIINAYEFSEKLPEVDMIVVTIVNEEEDIKNMCENVLSYRIVTLSEVINSFNS